MEKDYIEDIKLSYPECGIVKDPFLLRLGKSIGLEHVSRFWESNGTYRLTFNYIHHPMTMPFLMFANNPNGKPTQITFNVGKSVVRKLEQCSMLGYEMFVSYSIWKTTNVVWPRWCTYEQKMISLDLTLDA